MAYKKLTKLTENDVRLICSHQKDCLTCGIYLKNMTNCITLSSKDSLSIVYDKNAIVYVPNTLGTHLIGGTPLINKGK